MTSMTSEGPMANTLFVGAPQNGYPGIPGNMSQVPLYPVNQAQVQQLPGSTAILQLPVCAQPTQVALKEGKVLGVIQILIGLIHFGLGIILGTIHSGPPMAILFSGGYAFWGGIMFIISGSLSVSSEKYPKSSCLLNGSTGMNIVSAIGSEVGSILCITEMSINNNDDFSDFTIAKMAISGVTLIFSLLEFCVACTSAHFGCQLACSSQNIEPVVFQAVYVTNPRAIPEAANSPPSYSSEVLSSK